MPSPNVVGPGPFPSTLASLVDQIRQSSKDIQSVEANAHKILTGLVSLGYLILGPTPVGNAPQTYLAGPALIYLQSNGAFPPTGSNQTFMTTGEMIVQYANSVGVLDNALIQQYTYTTMTDMAATPATTNGGVFSPINIVSIFALSTQ